ncbi:RHS repeat-associated core domain-containing protein [Pseudomonas syringae]|uniref:RHS repeat-associated core domain-containing protein n=1 Tax=Pseudomonas syringae TaxID=317 RepID=UPI00233F8E9A|nr:RHS repeat-associated core domain-containing protein [Pseudomonas syringae]
MASSGQSVLCVYRYDGLDRLADCAPAGQGSTRFFYQKTHLATQIQGQIQHTLMRTDEHLLACLSAENNQRDGVLLATDQQQSVIVAQGAAFAYTPYGHRHPSAGPMSLPGYAGQRVDPVTGHYLLGNGYRAFNPVLMRFNSPDSLSPFGEGGVNAYGYCGGDPVNREDKNGHIPNIFKPILRAVRVIKNPRRVLNNHYEKIIAARKNVDRASQVIAKYDQKGLTVPGELKEVYKARLDRLSSSVYKEDVPPPNYYWAIENKPVHAPEAILPTFERAMNSLPGNDLLVWLPTYGKDLKNKTISESIESIRR